MQYTRLGSSGLKISRIALGCMSFGDTSRGFNEWALNDDAAEPIFRQAVELGITLWDTANAYGYGTSEEIVGRAVKKYTRREDVVRATKGSSRCMTAPAVPGCPGGQSSSNSTSRCIDWAPTTSISTRSTASTRTPRSRKRWKRCTTS